MARKNSINKKVAKWSNLVREEICEGRIERSAFVSVIDKKTTEICAFQVGEPTDIPFEHIAYLLTAETKEAIVDSLFEVSDIRKIRELVELITSRMGKCEIEDDEEEGEEWKTKEKIDGNLPCMECAMFIEKSMGFGSCRHHEGMFDGLDSNKENNKGKACKYIKRI